MFENTCRYILHQIQSNCIDIIYDCVLTLYHSIDVLFCVFDERVIIMNEFN